ncbi:type II toxin-antitoxin system RelE family toxin [Lachnospira multipara]|uniref:mRNA interferase RelE/StbE n=1 Tax=Lachnospira multipara TaxID=28051 RepID=A0A1H5VSY3_9FIRM|nr:type II toxin-antitoxin system RelE/ParE family toxin [Lachnospira multipara]SEF89647.1 mRNA interferase RelE/StbE [Lachnospira multipara]
MKNIVDEVRYSKSALKFIKSRNAKEKQRIKDIIENNLKHLPATGDIKPLEGFSDGRKRLRIGSIRIIFRYDDNNLLILSVLDIGNRGDIYK